MIHDPRGLTRIAEAMQISNITRQLDKQPPPAWCELAAVAMDAMGVVALGRVPRDDPTSARLSILLYDGLTAAMVDSWWPTSERMRIASVVYETLRLAGVEIRLVEMDR